MKRILTLLLWSLLFSADILAQSPEPVNKKVTTDVKSEKHLSSSILLWIRTDKPRQAGMDRWKGPHSKIISANKGMEEYRQLHLSETNPGLWPGIPGIETAIPVERKIDGVADVTLKNVFSLLRGRKQNRLAFQDEVNLFKRTILYAALGNKSRQFAVTPNTDSTRTGSIVFLRRKEGVDSKAFSKFIMDELTPTLANMGVLIELRSKVYTPWKQKQWDTPNVAHDNPREVQFQASLMLGFRDKKAMSTFFESNEVKNLADRLAVFCSAVHAYDIDQTLTFVKDGRQLPHFEK